MPLSHDAVSDVTIRSRSAPANATIAVNLVAKTAIYCRLMTPSPVPAIAICGWCARDVNGSERGFENFTREECRNEMGETVSF